MNKYKNDFKDIFQLTGVIITICLLSSDKFDLLKKALIFLWLGAIVLSFLDDMMFRFRLKKHEIRYPTINDISFKYSKRGFGLITLALSVLCWLWIEAFQEMAPIGIAAGVLIIIASMFDLPGGTMRFKSDNIKLSGIPEKIGKDSIKMIEIEESQIVLIDSSSKVLKQERLKLDPIAALAIEQFLTTGIGYKGIIKNKVR